MDVSGLGGGDHLFHGGVGLAVGDVLKNRAGKEPRILKHHGVGKPQALPGKGLDILSVHGDHATLRIVKAHEEIDQGGLPRTRMADDGNGGAAGSSQAQVVDDRLPRKIAEADVLHGNVPFCVLQHDRIGSVGGFRLLVHQPEDPFGCRQGRLQLADDVGGLVDRAGKFPGIEDEGGNGAQGQHPV